MTFCISCTLDWSAVTALATVGLLIATILLVFYGRGQLKALNETSKRNFLHQLKKDFFTDQAREILALLECELLTFSLTKLNDESDRELAFFEVKTIGNETARTVLKNISSGKTNISSYEMDDFLLQHLEDLGLLFKQEIVDIYNIDQLFGYYVVAAFENSEIKKYIDWARQDDDDIYSNFEHLYHTLKLYQSEH